MLISFKIFLKLIFIKMIDSTNMPCFLIIQTLMRLRNPFDAFLPIFEENLVRGLCISMGFDGHAFPQPTFSIWASQEYFW